MSQKTKEKKPIEYYKGEYKAGEDDIRNTEYKIGPLSSEQIEKIRYDLAWDWYYDDTCNWYVDEKEKTIYCDKTIKKGRLHQFINEYGCNIFKRKWVEIKT